LAGTARDGRDERGNAFERPVSLLAVTMFIVSALHARSIAMRSVPWSHNSSQDTLAIDARDHRDLDEAGQRHTGRALEMEINKKYVNKVRRHRFVRQRCLGRASEQVFPELGLCICLFSILDSSEGVITFGDGRVHYKGASRCRLLFATPIRTTHSLVPARRLQAWFRRGPRRPRRQDDGQGHHRCEAWETDATTKPTRRAVSLGFFDNVWIPRERFPVSTR
jgi:hypothetical protein